jgi:CheY-like chemotaxis protein
VKKLKALVVENDQQSVAMIDEVLLAMDHEYQVADCLLDAKRLIRAGHYDYLLLAALVPARAGGTPSVPNTHRVLRQLAQARNGNREPVIVLMPPEDGYPEPTKRAVVRMTHGFMCRGVADFIDKPFPTAGRTLDRVIEKVLGIDDGGPLDFVPPARDNGATDGEGEEEKAACPRTESPAAAHLTKMQLDILEAMAASPAQTLVQVDIIVAGGYGKHATRQCLAELEKIGFVHRPQGDRKGFAVTDEGRDFIKRARAA